MNIIELLEQSKTKLGVSSDYALAKGLEMPTQRIADYRKGTRHPDPYALVKIALLLDLDPLTLIAEAEAQTEKNPVRKGFWQNFVRRVGSLAAVAVLCCTAIFGSVSAGTGGGFSRFREYA